MPDADFDFAVAQLLRNEGGYSPPGTQDPGGETNFGICKRDNPGLDIAKLTRADAVTYYKRTRWDRFGLGRLASRDVATKLLDMMVNLGDETAITLAQRAVNYLVRRADELEPDGALGPKTVEALNHVDGRVMVLALRAYHARRYVELVEGPDPRFETFARDWLIRAMS